MKHQVFVITASVALFLGIVAHVTPAAFANPCRPPSTKMAKIATQVWASVRRNTMVITAIIVMEETADMADTEEMAEMQQIVETQEIQQQQLHQATLMGAATSNQLAEMLMAVEAEMAETL